jgi:LPPG:FO 2-phospho-L-lactate transferase
MQITALAGGIGGARFLRGLRQLVESEYPGSQITVIGNTGDDIWVHGLRVCPDLDTVMYTLGDGISEERGWGRDGETFTVKDELASYGVEPAWFGLGDKDIATHLVRTQSLAAGYSLTAALCEHWKPRVRLLPMTDERAETHVIVDDPSGATATDGTQLRTAIHFQEWWIRYRAGLPAHGFALVGIDAAKPGPDVVAAIMDADVVLFPPSNPVVSIGPMPCAQHRRRWWRSPPSSAAHRCGEWPTRASRRSASRRLRGPWPLTMAHAHAGASSTRGWSTPPMLKPLQRSRHRASRAEQFPR